MLLGYARVSKADDQDTAAQVGALRAAGCKRVFEEKASGGRWDRPELHRLLDQPGQTHEGLRSYRWGPFGEGTGAKTLRDPAKGGVSEQIVDRS